MLKTISSIVNAIGALNYKGTWNASTNTPTLASGVGTKGDYYVVSVAGSTNLDGETLWGVGDWAVFNGSIWQKVDGGSTGNFISVNTGTLDVTGNTTLGDASTDTVRVNGYIGFNGTPLAYRGIEFLTTLTGATSALGINCSPIAASDVTSTFSAIRTLPRTTAAAYTVSSLIGVLVSNASKGAGSVITEQVGVSIADQTQGTNNYGITSLVSSGANKYNIYASGTAQNYFAGNVGIGTASPGARLDITSSAAFTARFSGPANTYIDVTDGTGTFRAQLISNSPFLTSVGAYPLTFGTNNTERMRLDTSGNLLFNTNVAVLTAAAPANSFYLNSSGNLGLGTATPATKLHLLDAGAVYIQMTDSGDGASRIGQNGTALTFGVDGSNGSTERMRLDSAGNLAIGTATASAKLHVAGTNTGSTFIGGIFSNEGLTAGSTVRINFLSGEDGTVGRTRAIIEAVSPAANDGALVFQTRSAGSVAERMRLTAGGNLGLGVTPSAWFASSKVIQAGPGASISSRSNTIVEITSNAFLNTSGSWTYQNTGEATLYAGAGGLHRWSIAPSGTAGTAITFTQAMTLDTSGNLGIGTTSPVNKLQVVGSFGRGAPVTKTGNFTLADTENWIICNGTGTITVTLPAASSWTGREFTIKTIAAFTVISNASNVVPLAGGAAGTAILAATAGTWATLVSDGTNWIIMQA